MHLQRKVAAALARYRSPGSCRRAGVAVSGGADSVFLLHALHDLGIAGAVLHVNHKLRGTDSDLDQTFVHNLAGSLNLPFFVTVTPLPAGNTEQEARRQRYTFFAESIQSGICDTVATGHTLDDQAETVLSRFLRGSGTAGLSGIQPVTDSGIVRPLLDLRREEIRDDLRERGITWREDGSNDETKYLRNWLRFVIMPLFSQQNPALPQVLAATAEWAQGEEVYWSQELDGIEGDYFVRENEVILVKMALFLLLPVAVQRRLLRRGIERVRGSLRGIDFRHIEAIRDLTKSTEGSGRIQLPGLDIYRSFDWLRFAPIGYDSRLERNFEVPLTVPGRTAIPERHLALEMELVTHPRVYNKQLDMLDGDLCAGSLMLRNWQPGDRYRPLGKSRAEKIKTLFQDYRIPLWQRRHWPVVTSGDSIVWARQFGVACEFAATPASKRLLLIREEIREDTESKYNRTASMTLVGREFEVS